MESKPEEMQFYMSDITNKERDFGYISTMLRWKDTRFFGPPPRDYYQPADFFSENATQRIMVRHRESDITIIAYAEFSFYPLIGALPADCWIHWLKTHFCTSDKYPLTWGDTMFFTRFIFFPKYNPTLLNRILEEFFHREFKIRYVVILQMPNDENSRAEDTPCYDMLDGLSTVLYPRNFSVQNCHNVQRLHIIHRNKVIESMRYRKALPEDNDDIVEVIDVDRPDLREEYGDFYIAEELQKEIDENDTHNTFIACELQHQTVGFIWLNDDVSILTLAENFECEGYGNMLRFSRHKPFLEKRINVSGIELKPYYRLFTAECINEIYEQDLERLISKTQNNKKDYTCKRPTCPGIQAKMRMGFGTSDDKYFPLREEFLRKIQLIESYLNSLEYYQVGFRKRLRIPYNVPESYNPAEDPEFPLDAYSNVFAIKLLGLNKSTDTRFASRFIATAFTAYPDRDYCIISIPNRVKLSRSVSMLLSIFVSLVPRPGSRIDDHVYIINRSTIFGSMGAMNILKEDVPYIEKIIAKSNAMLNKRASTYSVNLSQIISAMPPEVLAETRLVQRALTDVFDNPNSDYHFLTIRCGDSMRPMASTTIVGFVIVRPFYRQCELGYRYHFIVNEISFKRTAGEIVLLRLHPNFLWESDAIFRHISCVTGYWEFYYMAPTMSQMRPLTNDLVKQMQPIQPRPIPQIHRKDFMKPPPSATSELEGDQNVTYSIYYHNLLPSKTYGSSEPIIMIGFNNLTRAFLRKLLFNFTHESDRKGHCCLVSYRVVVISSAGLLEGAYDSEFKCDVCEKQEDCYINFENRPSYVRDTTRCMDLRKFFSFVSSSVVKVNRAERTVVLANGCELFYSKLIFSLNTRFGLPPALQDSSSSNPSNYMAINQRFHKIKLYYKLKAILSDRNANDISIIVFGAHLQAFECMNFLLSHKIPPQAITMVIPWNPEATKSLLMYNICHIDMNIELILQQMVEDLGVKVEAQWKLKNFVLYQNEDIISHVIFEHYSDADEMTLPCDLFINFNLLHTGSEAKGLMAQMGIETKGTSVLIDENFCTSDPNIYAIGSFAKMRNEPNHQYIDVSCEETSAKLIYSLKLNADEDAEYTPKYSKPVYFQAQLPMGYYMAKVVLPKRYIANHLDNNYSLSLHTYDGNFSRVRLNEHGIVEEITCVTQTRHSLDHLQYFVGQHESLLNDLHSRWYLNEIRSFLDFFKEPWTELIMHPYYDELRRRIRSLTIDSAKEIMREHPDMDRKSRKDYMKYYMNNLQHSLEIEKTLLRFLRKYRSDFVYAFALPEDFHLNLAGKLNM